MGAGHATLASTDDDVDLPRYVVDQRLYPGSGRMMRTYRLKQQQHNASSSSSSSTSSTSGVMTVVAKTMWVSQDHEMAVKEQVDELRRIQTALRGQAHVSPFLLWHVGDYRTKPGYPTPIRPVHIVRPHVYTTLSDRLASRPFLTHVEKLWIVHQILGALQAMHDQGVVHGFLTTENVGLSSWNWVVLLDVASYKARTALPDDDPSEYLYYFEELHKHGTDTTPREKRCYLAPERFYTHSRGTSKSNTTISSETTTTTLALTPAMDIFSAGCVFIETFLNGERALDLGDLMEYRRQGSMVPSLQQKLNKIESSSLRAACRHMLHVNPSQRLSAREYLELLESTMPPTFETFMTPFFHRITCNAVTPDARMALAASHYSKVLQTTMSITDKLGEEYFTRVLGPTMCRIEGMIDGHSVEGANVNKRAHDHKSDEEQCESDDRLMTETEALLKRLESLTFEEDELLAPSGPTISVGVAQAAESLPPAPTPVSALSATSANSLLIFLQLVLSTVRTALRPSSKLVGLRMLERLGKYSTDDARLQRIVPVTVSLLQDQDPLVRAAAVQVMTLTLSTIQTFPPSDSKIFPQYIFKRVSPLISDQSLVVRVAFAGCVASLADTAHRFLDITHAVRLYEAVGGGAASGSSSSTGGDSPDTDEQSSPIGGVFSDDIFAKLLDNPTTKTTTDPSVDVASRDERRSNTTTIPKKKAPNSEATALSTVANTLISSTYSVELATLHETVSRWVVHITTDQSDQSSPPKRSLLCDLTRLCNFFGRDGVMAFILPQILAFLNDRRDWQLRAALFRHLPSVCYIIGRAATEHFVLPCLETALVDNEDQVISRALLCLSALVEMGLLSRAVLVAPQTLTASADSEGNPNSGLLDRYVPLLMYHSPSVRRSAMVLVNTSYKAFGFPDGDVFLLPLLRSHLRFEPSSDHLLTTEGLDKCLVPPWTREKLDSYLRKLSKPSEGTGVSIQWTAIGIDISETDETPSSDAGTAMSRQHVDNHDFKSSAFQHPREGLSSVVHPTEFVNKDSLDDRTLQYLRMLAKSRTQTWNSDSEARAVKQDLANAIEGSLKLAQSTRIPRQRVSGTSKVCVPSWYSSRLEQLANEDVVPELCAIRSVSSLSQVYGLSLVQPGAPAGTVTEAEGLLGTTRAPGLLFNEENEHEDGWKQYSHSTESKTFEAACLGEWGSDSMLDPTASDTTLLLAKLKGLHVPPLPPDLAMIPSFARSVSPTDVDSSGEWRPSVDALVASSSAMTGHTAPVSRLAVAHDQQFFVSSSFDGTCKVWELAQIEDSDGILESSTTYSGHSFVVGQSTPRINDVVIIEHSHSVASASSDGSVHVWRVDMVSGSKRPGHMQNETRESLAKPGGGMEGRVSGSSMIRNIDPSEGEVLAVSHFNSSTASVLIFATQSCVHSWDLRSSRVPFRLKHQPDLGYITSMSLGSDRQWVVTGSSRGCIALWDIRFQRQVKLWQHSNGCPITRIATSYAAMPKLSGRNGSDLDHRPYFFASTSPNECAMFDVTNGSCRQCFRVTGHSYSTMNTTLPLLNEVPISRGNPRRFHRLNYSSSAGLNGFASDPTNSINALVGSVGGNDSNYVITGGDDSIIRYWDFTAPSKCYTVSGLTGLQHRPSYERIDHEEGRIMVCRQARAPRLNDIESSKVPRMLQRGMARAENRHHDSIQDLKLITFPMKGLISCSGDGIVKIWR